MPLMPGGATIQQMTGKILPVSFDTVYELVFSERTTLRSLYAIGRPSVCLSVVCDVGAPYSCG